MSKVSSLRELSEGSSAHRPLHPSQRLLVGIWKPVMFISLTWNLGSKAKPPSQFAKHIRRFAWYRSWFVWIHLGCSLVEVATRGCGNWCCLLRI